MHSFIRKMSFGHVVRRRIASKSVTLTSVNVGKDYSTIENSLPSCLVTQNILKSTLRSLSTTPDNVFDNERRDYLAIFPDIVRELTEKANICNANLVLKRLAEALQYNVSQGNANRGVLTVLAFKKLSAVDQLTSDTIRMAQYLGWCLEMLQATIVMADDIFDFGLTRYGKACWYKLDNVGMSAINDALMIENAAYLILSHHFRHADCYSDLINLFHETMFMITSGQSLDLLTSNRNVSTFTMDTYNSIVINKVAFASFYTPFALGMRLAGFKDIAVFGPAKETLLGMGHLLQVQDDFLDCFGDSKDTVKISTDIQNNRCSWLAVICMQKANDEQKKIMAECYGKNDPAKIARVEKLYVELDLPNMYATYEEESLNKLKTNLQKIPDSFPGDVMLEILNKIAHSDLTY